MPSEFLAASPSPFSVDCTPFPQHGCGVPDQRGRACDRGQRITQRGEAMKPNLIYQLLDLAIDLTRTQFDSGDEERILLELVQKSIQAYEEQMGEPLNPLFIRPRLAI